MPTIYPLIMGRRAMIATEHYLSAAAGARIFACGGNAIDAAIAATFVEGVVNPHMHTIGGEAPMLIYSASARRVVAINGNMMAPARATIAHFRSLGLELIPGAGLLAAGVPAAFDALVTALRDFGTRSLADVLEPALQLAARRLPDACGIVRRSRASPMKLSPGRARLCAVTRSASSPSGRRRGAFICPTAKCRCRGAC